MNNIEVTGTIGHETLCISTGLMAKQAGGAAVVRYGETIVLVTAVGESKEKDLDFFPLTVDYREKAYAAGKFPGGYIKRESRPTTKEILTMRLIDRPVRPLFPKGYTAEVQVMAVVLSADDENDPDVLAMVGASAALSLSDLPFRGPTGSVRVGRVDGEWVVNPTHAQMDESDVDMIVAGTEDAILMVEGEAQEVPETDLVQAISFAHESIRQIVALQHELLKQCNVEPKTIAEPEADTSIYDALKPQADEVKKRLRTPGKMERSKAVKAFRNELVEQLASDDEEDGKPSVDDVKSAFEKLERFATRDMILDEGLRSDGRKTDEIRDITIDVSALPRTHGSALFTRGETQALVVATLGTKSDQQKVETLKGESSMRFMLHYNFPPFCVGEAKPIRGPGRREIGHGHLAERSLQAVLPPPEDFAYTIRVVSDILESNGSSSMATVCGGTMALMDAGVPIRAPVAGIALGLIKEGDQVAILSDILGSEDHCGDMDFKVAGTEDGVTGLQMDIKIAGIDAGIMGEALEQARVGRLHILSEMKKALAEPRAEVSSYAPRLLQIMIDPDKIGSIIGPGGKIIKKIQEETGTRVEIDDDGSVVISSTEAGGAEEAKRRIEHLTEDVQVNKIYDGKIATVKDFGAFVEILPGKDGLLHISEMSDEYVERVEDFVQVGDQIKVKVVEIDPQGKIRLSRKGLSDE